MVLVAVAVLGSACSSDPTVVAAVGDDSARAEESGTTTSLTPSEESLRVLGTAWVVTAIDGEPVVDHEASISFAGSVAEPYASIDDRCGVARVEVDLAEGLFVRSIDGLDRLCHDAWPVLFEIDRSTALEVSDTLMLQARDHVLVARHFDSVSEVGPVPVPGFGDQPVTVPSPPLPYVEEATQIPFPECSTLGRPGPPEGERLTELRQVRRQLEGILGERLDTDGVVRVTSIGGPQSIYGVISVGVSHRHQPTIDWLAERAGPDDLCLELPPVGYYDTPPHLYPWEFADPTDADNPDLGRFIARLDIECGLIDKGRLLEPRIDYQDDAIFVAIPVRQPTFGPTLSPCPFPDLVEIELTEPRAGRLIVVDDRSG